MNLDLIYTIGIGNSKSYISIYIVQFFLYILSIDMSSFSQGFLIAIIMSMLISTISMFVIQYFNSSAATIDGVQRYIRTLKDKMRLFRKVIVISHLTSLIILTMLYMFQLGIANYYIYTAPMSLIILLIAIIMHDDSISKKYAELKTQTWVFDYNKTPVVKAVKQGRDNAITMFDTYNKLVVNESDDILEIEDIFMTIPPGTKVVNSEMMKPNYQLINFNHEFKYTSIGVAKSIYLKYSDKKDEKLFDLYIDVLSKYKSLYLVDVELLDCSKTSIQINEDIIENIIESSDYVKKFVSSKDTKVGKISIQLSENIASLPVYRFLQTLGKRVEDYDLKKVKNSLYISENMGKDNYIETDISYLQKYMSLNLAEYFPQKLEVVESEIASYHSMEEKIESKKQRKKAEEASCKSLYQLNIKGELIYLFLEDIATMAEFDELIVHNFINKDINELLKKIKKTI